MGNTGRTCQTVGQVGKEGNQSFQSLVILVDNGQFQKTAELKVSHESPLFVLFLAVMVVTLMSLLTGLWSSHCMHVFHRSSWWDLCTTEKLKFTQLLYIYFIFRQNWTIVVAKLAYDNVLGIIFLRMEIIALYCQIFLNKSHFIWIQTFTGYTLHTRLCCVFWC